MVKIIENNIEKAMMKNTKTGLITIALLTTIMGGCSFFKGGEEATTPETLTPEENAQQPPATPPPTVPFEKPTVPKVPPVSVLTPATDPDARAKNVQIGIPNPFALMPKPQSIKVDPDVVMEGSPDFTTVPGVTPIPPSVTPIPSSNGTNPSAGGTNNGTLAGSITNSPPSLPQPTIPTLPGGSTPSIPPLVFTPQLPLLPEPSLARAVQVTGMITIGSETKIILQAPNEPFSRYVKTGEYISDGQVLVKRIEGSDRGTPVIILEQFGIEVAKRVEPPSSATTSEVPPVPPQV